MALQRGFSAVLKFMYMALPVTFAASFVAAAEIGTVQSESNATQALAGKLSGIVGGHLSVGSRIRELLDHPGFQGFAHLLLPWDKRDYELDMPLGNLGVLLPYHTLK